MVSKKKAGRATGVKIPTGGKEEAQAKPLQAFDESSLRERAVLIHFTIGRWYGSGADMAVVEEIRQAKEATGEIGAFTKRMMKRERLQEINAVTNAARRYHKLMTLPWGDGGARLLSSDVFVEYKKKMTAYEQDFNAAVENFLAQYPVFVKEEKKNLGALYRESDYPSAEDMRFNFRFLVAIDVIPDSKDIRVKLSAEQAAEIRKDVEARTHESLKAAVGSIYARIGDQLKEAKRKLDEGTVRVNMFSGMQEVIDLLPKLNILNDPDLNRLGREVQHDLLSVDVGALKEDTSMVKATGEKAAKLLKSLDLLQKKGAK